jgi:Ca2+-binding EF-hand superfamily protein
MSFASVLLAFALAATAAEGGSAAPADGATPTASGGDTSRELVLLAEGRPIFLRLRVTLGDRPFDAAWPDSIRALYVCLDRDGDGKLTTKEADKDVVAALIRLATGAPAAPLREELDSHPKDGVVSVEELTEALRPALGPFRIQIGRIPNGRTDALFDHLDRDKDGQLTRPELAAIAGSLRRLDLDDNEMISADELEPFNSVAAMAQLENASARRARLTAVPPVVELVAGESPLRVVRLLIKKYDKGRGEGGGRPDSKLSLNEFAIDPDVFAAADKNHDGSLNSDELRRLLSNAPSDLVLEVKFSADGSARATTRVSGGENVPKGVQVRQLADGDVEFAVGQVRLDIHVDDDERAAENFQRVVTRQFEAADANKDGYLEGKELAAENAPQSLLTGLTQVIDRDGDGKLYAKELKEFTDRQLESARGRMVCTVSDQGRTIFGILDSDRDRRLGAREIMRTVDRVSSWDGDSDGRVTADEIPYHFQVNVARGELSAVPVPPQGVVVQQAMTYGPKPVGSANGPDWFRRMDRNRDGDVSRREFLGPREAFERLDRDKDGLIDADEAGAPTAATNADSPKVGP